MMASSVEMVLGVDITVGSCVCARGWKAEVYGAARLKRVAHARWADAGGRHPWSTCIARDLFRCGLCAMFVMRLSEVHSAIVNG